MGFILNMRYSNPLYWLQVSIGSGKGLVPSGNKPLPEPMLTAWNNCFTLSIDSVHAMAHLETTFNELFKHMIDTWNMKVC